MYFYINLYKSKIYWGEMEQVSPSKKVVTLISITSDIGTALAERYSKQGHTIIGTYRSTNTLDKLRKISNCHLFYCDIENKKNVHEFINEYKKLNLEWDTFISCACNPLPLKAFFKSDFEEWSKSIHVNSIEQLRVLYELYPFRKKNQISNVVYFAGGGGANTAVKDFSAYNLAKIMLTKMGEFLDAENKDINVFVIGPGWTKTKTHNLILKNVSIDDEKYKITKDFLDNKEGTSMDDIFNCIEWLCKEGKEVAGGRNFSVVHDKWGNKELSSLLKSDKNIYKLRRFGNNLVLDK